MKPKVELLDFKFDDYRDWFISEEEKKEHVRVGTLAVKIKKVLYKINNVPYNVKYLRILFNRELRCNDIEAVYFVSMPAAVLQTVLLVRISRVDKKEEFYLTFTILR